MAYRERPVGFDRSDAYLPRPASIAGIPRPVSASTPDADLYARKVEIPSGARGTTATLRAMAEIIAENARDPYLISVARGIVRGIPSKEHQREADALLQWVFKSVDYRFDPFEVDWFQSPGWTLFVEGQSDCDDASGAICALDMAAGLGCKLRAVRLDPAQPDEFTHVYAMAGYRDDRNGEVVWLAQDPVPAWGPGALFKKPRLGWEPPVNQWIGPPNDLVIAMP